MGYATYFGCLSINKIYKNSDLGLSSRENLGYGIPFAPNLK